MVSVCKRKNCSNILCDTYITDIGYICFDCQKEFQEYLKKKDKNPTTEYEIKEELKTFMKTNKGAWSEQEKISVDKFFNDNTNYCL